MDSDLKSEVLRQLNKGSKGAITGKILAKRLDERDTRQIRLAIEELITDGIPICSSPHNPYGYFIAETPEEVKESLKTLRSYGKMLWKHYWTLKRAGQKQLSGQMSLRI